MVGWAQRFQKAVGNRRVIWGLHNYIDANRFRTRGTRALLRAVKGDVWFTETGGLVVRRNGSTVEFPGSTRHAAKATSWVFRLAALSPRVKRVYFYHWSPAPTPRPTWDSALVDRHDRPRPAYRSCSSGCKSTSASTAGRRGPGRLRRRVRGRDFRRREGDRPHRHGLLADVGPVRIEPRLRRRAEARAVRRRWPRRGARGQLRLARARRGRRRPAGPGRAARDRRRADHRRDRRRHARDRPAVQRRRAAAGRARRRPRAWPPIPTSCLPASARWRRR